MSAENLRQHGTGRVVDKENELEPEVVEFLGRTAHSGNDERLVINVDGANPVEIVTTGPTKSFAAAAISSHPLTKAQRIWFAICAFVSGLVARFYTQETADKLAQVMVDAMQGKQSIMRLRMRRRGSRAGNHSVPMR